MQARPNSKLPRWSYRTSVVWLLACGLGLLTAVSGQGQVPAVPPPAQGHAAWLFLGAVLRADYAAAYSRLAPEVQQRLSRSQFEAAARPLWKSRPHRSSAIELYKLGMRLNDDGTSRLFYTFSYAADSMHKPPPVLLEVTFRDAAAQTILSFELRAVSAAKKAITPATRKAK